MRSCSAGVSKTAVAIVCHATERALRDPGKNFKVPIQTSGHNYRSLNAGSEPTLQSGEVSRPPPLTPGERFEQPEYRSLWISKYRNLSGIRHCKWRLIGLPPIGLCVLCHGLDSRNLIVDEPVGSSLTFLYRRNSADVIALVENVQVTGRIVFAGLGFPTKKFRVKFCGLFGIGGSEIGKNDPAVFGRYACAVMSLRLPDSEHGAGRILNNGHSAHIKYVEW